MRSWLAAIVLGAALVSIVPAPAGADDGLVVDAPGVKQEIELRAPAEDGAGRVPTFKWAPVKRAAVYRVVVQDANGEAFWAWQGKPTSVVLGAVRGRPPAGEAGAIVRRGSRWSVVALDATGKVLAASRLRGVSP